MVCPDCTHKMSKSGGGNRYPSGLLTGYRICKNEDCHNYGRRGKFHTLPGQFERFVGWVEDVDTGMSLRESLRVLRLKVRDDLGWFGELAEETVDFARMVARQLL